MSHRVVLLASATRDLQTLRRYLLRRFSAAVWQDSYDKIKASIRALETFPLAGGIPEEIERLNLTQYRQALAGMNRIIYEVRQSTVYIPLIAAAREDMQSLLTRRLLSVP